MSEEYTKQHIVPKCYLDRFATCKNGKYIIGTRHVTPYNKVRLFEDSTSNVGNIKNYYDVSDKEDPKYWEHYLANKIDSLCDIKLGRLISSIKLAGKGFILDNNNKLLLATIIVSQLLRTPSSFEYVRDHIIPRSSKNTIDQIGNKYSNSDVTRKAQEIMNSFLSSDSMQKEFYLNVSFNEETIARYAEVLFGRTWLIYINKMAQEMPFITSDNPVLVENIYDHNSLGVFQNGIANPGTCLFFPLTPSIAVANYSDRGIFSFSANQLDGRIYYLNKQNVAYIAERNRKLMDQARIHSFIPQPLFDTIQNSTLGKQ